MAIRILVDASVDISKKDAEKQNIEIIPMMVTINDKEYYAGLNLENEQFYHLLQTESVFPKTTQLTPQNYLDYYTKAKDRGDELIVITLSSGLSGTYQSAILAKKIIEYDNIYVVDSLYATMGIRLLAEHAATLRDARKSAKEIFDCLEALKKRIKLYAIVDTLEYLYKGGRLTKAQAVVGDLINLKPIITFKSDGTLAVAEKKIGKIRAMNALMKLIQKYPIDTNYPIYYVYAVHSEDTEKLANSIKDEYNLDYTHHIYELGPVIGAHIGPGAIGIIYVEKN